MCVHVVFPAGYAGQPRGSGIRQICRSAENTWFKRKSNKNISKVYVECLFSTTKLKDKDKLKVK